MRGTVAALAAFLLISIPIAASAQMSAGDLMKSGGPRPGELIGSIPIENAPGDMRAWHITYWTTDGEGRSIRASGIVAAPHEPTARPRDILAWTHGAWGVTERCAPSLSPNFWKMTPGLDGVRRGYVVVAPDYPGLGSKGAHPFLVGEDTGRSVLDAVRAARFIPSATAGSRFAVWGESQGGHAALWTGQIAKSYAPELQLVGVAAAAPPTDLVRNLQYNPDGPVQTLFKAFIGYSWSQQYKAPLATLGGGQTRGIVTKLAKKNCIELESTPRLGTIAGILTLQSRWKGVDMGSIEPWAGLARTNSPTTAAFGVPLLIGQNPKDELISPDVTKAHAQALCRAGAPLYYMTINGAGHATSARDSASDTLDWISDRFASHRPPTNCGRF